jgi:hypothetical protein
LNAFFNLKKTSQVCYFPDRDDYPIG